MFEKVRGWVKKDLILHQFLLFQEIYMYIHLTEIKEACSFLSKGSSGYLFTTLLWSQNVYFWLNLSNIYLFIFRKDICNL